MAYPQYNQFFPQYQQQAYQMPQQQASIQNQANNGLVPIQSEMDARSYPVALGNSVTFKDENAPYIYTKTMGFSQLDRPVFEKYRLVKEEPDLPQEAPLMESEDKSIIDDLKGQIEAIKGDISEIKKKLNKPKKVVKEVDEDDDE